MNLFAGLEEIVKENEPLAPHTWYRLGGPARYYVEPRNKAELLEVAKRCSEHEQEIFVLGRGSNVLVRDEGIDGVVVRLNDKHFGGIEIHETTVRVESGVDMSHLVGVCARSGLRGLECMIGIPGSVGGQIKQNAGGKFGDIGSVVSNVFLMDQSGYEFNREREEIFFGYRDTNIMAKFILGAEFVLTPDDPDRIGRSIKEVWMFKKATQPLNTRNAGCVFKNPPNVSCGSLIERAGLMGKSVGGAEVSDRHANFIVANNGATSAEVLELIDLVRTTVKEKFEVEMETEIQIWP